MVDLELQLGQLNQSNPLAMDPYLLLGGHLVLGHLLLLVLLMVVELKQAMLGRMNTFHTDPKDTATSTIALHPDRDQSPVTEV